MVLVGNRKFYVTAVFVIKTMVPVVDSRDTVRRNRTGKTADQITIICLIGDHQLSFFGGIILLRIRYNFKTRISYNFTTRELLHLYVVY